MVHFLFDPSTVGYEHTIFLQDQQHQQNQKGGGISNDSNSENISSSDNENGHADRFSINGPGTYFFRGSVLYQRGYGGGFLHRRRGGGGLAAYNRLVRYRQKGSGIGDILRGLWRILFPVLKRTGISIGKEGIQTGERILNRLSQGEKLKESVISEGKKGIDNLLEEGGLHKQFGTGLKENSSGKRKKKSSILPSHQTLIGRAVKINTATSKNGKSFEPKRKRIRSDTFGFY